MGRRIAAMARKEFIHLRRDRRTLALIVVIPLVWLLLFGYAFSFDVSDLRVAVVDQSGTAVGRILAGALRGYPRFRVADLLGAGPGAAEADARRRMGEEGLDMAVILPPGFGEAEGVRLRVLIDGSRLFAAQAGVRLLQEALAGAQDEVRAELHARMERQVRERLERELEGRLAEARERVRAEVEAAARRDAERRQAEARALLAQLPPEQRRVAADLLARLAGPARPPAPGLPQDLFRLPDLASVARDAPAAPDMVPDVEILYNPELESAPVMIPGLLGLVTMLATTLLVALGIAREREYGTLEQLAVTPLRPPELIVGKVLPYVVLAAVDFVLVLAASLYLFGLRPAGDLGLFCGLTVLFLLTTVGLGILVSTVSQNQQQAMQLAFFLMFPQVLLSGLIFPIESMPRPIQWISTLLPFTYFVPVARGIFLKGQGLEQLWPQAAVLAGYGALLITAAAARLRRGLA